MTDAGQRIGDYEIIRTLGQGAFGRTLLAKHVTTGRDVAIKLLDTRGRVEDKADEMFRREADVLRAVRHHGIPEIFETFQAPWQGAPAALLVMEYIEGTSLADIIDSKRTLAEADVTHLFLELLGILDYLHGRVPPILHRDIKPSNIIVRPNGFPALVDFGSVRRVFMAPDETGSTVAGTYGYMPYEQYMGQAAPASDLYSLGATFLHLLTGRPPRDFMTDEGRLQAPDSLPVEPRLRSVIARLLRPSPAERFASARDVRHALTGGPTAPASSALARTDAPRAMLHRTARTAERIAALPPAPRALTGETAELLKRSAPTAVRLMSASEKNDGVSTTNVLFIVGFSALTFGVLPAIFYTIASTRRKRMKKFFQFGVPGVARFLKSELQKTAFDEHLTRVTYEFMVDGALHRDSDVVLPAIADRWQPGDDISILYMPDRDYDSVIVAVE
jgi:serine/threonine protein kinase